MSRTRKRPNPYKGTQMFMECPRHGRCSWCDRNRQHNKLKTDAEMLQDIEDWQDDYGP